MTDPVKRPNLLPSNATPRERAHADTDGRLDDRAAEAAQIVALKDPDNTPEAIEPYVAWEKSVDVWDPPWLAPIRRAAIKAAPEVHAYKGTPRAMRIALSAFGIDAEIVEWWQTSPPGRPYTFKLTAHVHSRLYEGGELIDPRTVKVVFGTVMRVKPVSRAFDLVLAAGLDSRLGAAAVAVARSRVRVAAYADNLERCTATIGAVGVLVARSVLRLSLVSSDV
ncbi:phage tail protein I [Methylobacterium sp. 4-46]|uniref:phage tail protein I n=1 Tax=unclassified Methylobacterium TaxID=2615210 RepID=UPI000152DF53|nr:MULTISPECIES: phage tail protein I [Methylobacterium]ACA18491.1 phage tail protein I [Methylobacterium sp. 4-46]WFT77779.1 phage tail protein I [Methylobacterium nodulans]